MSAGSWRWQSLSVTAGTLGPRSLLPFEAFATNARATEAFGVNSVSRSRS